MKLFFTMMMLFSINLFAVENDPRWQMNCVSQSQKYPAKLYAIGSSVAVSVVVGYETAQLICSFNGPCVGIKFGSVVVPPGTASLILDSSRKVQGFSYKSAIGIYSFRCQ